MYSPISPTYYPPGDRSCIANNPDTRFVAIDNNEPAIVQTRNLIQSKGLTNVMVQYADLYNLPYETESFDHIFICLLLENLPDPAKALIKLKSSMKKGGSITVIEGDHGSTFYHPESRFADEVIRCQIELQQLSGGNALIGRHLAPLLRESGFRDIEVTPQTVYTDFTKPDLSDRFTKSTFMAMIKSIRDQSIERGLVDEETFNRGVDDLNRSADDGVFCYSFFKGTAIKPIRNR
jgi:ubiquinone/menaquinone biosynthesis C-methylase UbiE